MEKRAPLLGREKTTSATIGQRQQIAGEEDRITCPVVNPEGKRKREDHQGALVSSA